MEKARLSETIDEMVEIGKALATQGMLLCTMRGTPEVEQQIKTLKSETTELYKHAKSLRDLYDKYGDEEGTRLMWLVNEATSKYKDDSDKLRQAWFDEIEKLLK